MLGAALLLVCLLGAPPSEADDDLPPEDQPASGLPQPPPHRPMNLYALLSAEDRAAELARRHAKASSFAERVESVSRGLVAAPYLLSPLGEGEGSDPDPRFRVDAFDCTTFVETVIAMSLNTELDEVQSELDRIRYDGPPSFDDRRHLIALQWLPGLVEAGYLRDITKEVGGARAKTVPFAMDAARWKSRRIAKSLELPANKIPNRTVDVTMIPITDMLAIIEQVPPGTVLNVHREDRPWSPVITTHQAVVLLPRGEKIRIARHASPVSKRVIDETLEHMMKRYLKPRKWPIVGVSLFAIVPPKELRGLRGRVRGTLD